MPGESEGPDIPQAPSFQSNQFVNPNIGFLSATGQSLARGGFLPGRTPSLPGDLEQVNLDFLEPLVTTNPQVTQQALGLATREITSLADQQRQQTINQLEANNQLTSSTAVNRLSDLNQEFNQDIADVATRFFLADVERALSNQAGFFQTGLNLTGQATQLGLQDQRQRNQFSLQNFNNQVAGAIASEPTSPGGGLIGGGTGALIGGVAGGIVGGPLGGAIGAGIGGAGGAGLGAGLFPAQGQTDPGLGFISGGTQLAGTGLGLQAGSSFGPQQANVLGNQSPFPSNQIPAGPNIAELTRLRGVLGTA